MAGTGSTNSIADQAAKWAIEAAHGEMTPECRAELETWLAADRRHRGAYVRAHAWLRAAEEAVIGSRPAADGPVPVSSAPGSDNDNDERQGSVPSSLARSRVVRWSGKVAAGGAAIAACVGALIWVGVPTQVPYSAPAGEVVQLKDGSVATLREDARIQVVLTDDLRKITLLSGEATFSVAKDKSRPFVVLSGNIYAQATGTVYSVRRISRTGGAVSVAEGSVLVWPGEEREQAVLLHAGGTVTLDPGPSRPPQGSTISPSLPLPPPEVAQISLDNVPIELAAARFNRVNSTKIVVSDPAIGKTRIIGLYRADDPEHFAQAAATISGGVVGHENGHIVIKVK